MSVFSGLQEIYLYFRNRSLEICSYVYTIIFIFKYKQPMFGKLSSQPLLISRSTLGLIGVLLNIYAIDHMVLSDADTLMKLNPFWTILLSLIFLHEKVRKYQISAMIIAILGMLLIVKPEFSSSVIPSIAGLFSGIFCRISLYMRSCTKHS